MFFEQTRCIKCHATDMLEKIVPIVAIGQPKEEESKKVGDITKRHIEDAKKELKQMKEDIKEKEL